ncbi:MAG TPA: phosphoglucosamine mutase, partial [Gallionellaceae bacterium]|nr:phosphoglucosamine mutase [Gallionellaceae bacterium]
AGKQTLAQAAADLQMYPQVLLNVRVAKGADLLGHESVRAAVSAAETALHGKGRVLLRPSGTEPLLRVMVEGEDRAAVQHWAEQIAGVIRSLT